MDGTRRRSIRGTRIGAALLAGVLAGAAAAGAAEPRWVPLGPEGGTVNTVVAAGNGRTLYAGTEGGVFKSLNGGRSWLPSNTGLRGGVVSLLGVPGRPSIVYAVTTEGVFASSDAARTWSPRNAGLPPDEGHPRVRALAVAPSRPSTLYASVRTGTQTDQPAESVYRSQNGGVSWSRASRGLPGGGFPLEQVLALAVHPRRPELVLAATTLGLFRTTNGGETWAAADRSFFAFAFAFERTRPNFVYALAMQDEAVRVFVSSNAGRTWTARDEDFAGAGGPQVLEVDPARRGTAYVGTSEARVFKTIDAGRTWTEVGTGLGFYPVLDLAVDPGRPGVVYAGRLVLGDGPGLYRTVPGGAAWVPSARGIFASRVLSLAVDPSTEDLFAGIEHGRLWRSRDGGASWAETGLFADFGVEVLSVFALAVDPEAPGTVYAVAGNARSLYRSLDAGDHWQRVAGELQHNGMTELEVVDGLLYGVNFGGVHRWDPATATWEDLGPSASSSFAVSTATDPVTLWADSEGDIESTGVSHLLRLQPGDAVLTRVLDVPGKVTEILVHPLDPDRIAVAFTADSFVPRTGGFFTSRDGGATWTAAPAPVAAVAIFSAAFDPHDPDRIVAGASGRVFESTDGGATWHELGEGLAPGAGVAALVFDARSPARLFAATLGGGVFVLAPGG